MHTIIAGNIPNYHRLLHAIGDARWPITSVITSHGLAAQFAHERRLPVTQVGTVMDCWQDGVEAAIVFWDGQDDEVERLIDLARVTGVELNVWADGLRGWSEAKRPTTKRQLDTDR